MQRGLFLSYQGQSALIDETFSECLLCAGL